MHAYDQHLVRPIDDLAEFSDLRQKLIDLAGINRIDHTLTRVFGIKGDRFAVQERLETAVFEMWDKLQPETQGNVRKTARLISGSLNVDCRRVLSMLYRNGEVEKWNNLFSQGDLMKFSPAWYGKVQAT